MVLRLARSLLLSTASLTHATLGLAATPAPRQKGPQLWVREDIEGCMIHYGPVDQPLPPVENRAKLWLFGGVGKLALELGWHSPAVVNSLQEAVFAGSASVSVAIGKPIPGAEPAVADAKMTFRWTTPTGVKMSLEAGKRIPAPFCFLSGRPERPLSLVAYKRDEGAGTTGVLVAPRHAPRPRPYH